MQVPLVIFLLVQFVSFACSSLIHLRQAFVQKRLIQILPFRRDFIRVGAIWDGEDVRQPAAELFFPGCAEDHVGAFGQVIGQERFGEAAGGGV